MGQLELVAAGNLSNPYIERFGPDGSAAPGGHVATSTYSALVGDGEARHWRMGLIFMAA